MNNIYQQNKFIFNKLVNKNYKLKKAKNDKNILYIITPNVQIKCNYIFFLIRYKNDKIQWNNINPFIDNKTKNQTIVIHNKMTKLYEKINNNDTQYINYDDFNNIIKDLIKNNENFNENNDKWSCNWILTNKNNEYTEYYMITNIIYY